MVTHRLAFAGILLTHMFVSGCAHCTDSPIDLPPRPELIAVSPEVWARVPLEAQDTWTLNDLALKEYARKLESRISLHDEALD